MGAISFPPWSYIAHLLRGQFPVPRSILQLLTHKAEWWCVGACAGGDRLHSRKVTVTSCLLGHSVSMSTWCRFYSEVVVQLYLPPYQVRAKVRIARAAWFYVFFLTVSPLGQELLADFHWVLNFKFENKIQRAFTRPFFKAQKVVLLYLCSTLSFTFLDLIFPTKLWPWLRQQELLFVVFLRKGWLWKEKPCLRSLPGTKRPTSSSVHCLTVIHTMFLGDFWYIQPFLWDFKAIFSVTSNVDHLMNVYLSLGIMNKLAFLLLVF